VRKNRHAGTLVHERASERTLAHDAVIKYVQSVRERSISEALCMCGCGCGCVCRMLAHARTRARGSRRAGEAGRLTDIERAREGERESVCV